MLDVLLFYTPYSFVLNSSRETYKTQQMRSFLHLLLSYSAKLKVYQTRL